MGLRSQIEAFTNLNMYEKRLKDQTIQRTVIWPQSKMCVFETFFNY